jgi:hypothetical protein
MLKPVVTLLPEQPLVASRLRIKRKNKEKNK